MAKVLEDGSQASTGHKKATKSQTGRTGQTGQTGWTEITRVDKETRQKIKLAKEVEARAYAIRKEVAKLSELTSQISEAYSAYAESNTKVDSEIGIHNGLGNMLKLIEIQTTTKLRIKKIQTDIMRCVAENTSDEELPYAIQDVIKDINVNFLDSKLVRAYGEISKVMKEDLDIAKQRDTGISFGSSELSSELEELEEEPEEGEENYE